MNYNDYKEKLFTCLSGENYQADFLDIIDYLHKHGYKKKSIYNLFVNFHRDIQIDKRTKDDEDAYDRLSDFMDGFYNIHGFRILPEENI